MASHTPNIGEQMAVSPYTYYVKSCNPSRDGWQLRSEVSIQTLTLSLPNRRRPKYLTLQGSFHINALAEVWTLRARSL